MVGWRPVAAALRPLGRPPLVYQHGKFATLRLNNYTKEYFLNLLKIHDADSFVCFIALVSLLRFILLQMAPIINLRGNYRCTQPVAECVSMQLHLCQLQLQ